jgi:hypothetical protein
MTESTVDAADDAFDELSQTVVGLKRRITVDLAPAIKLLARAMRLIASSGTTNAAGRNVSLGETAGIATGTTLNFVRGVMNSGQRMNADPGGAIGKAVADATVTAIVVQSRRDTAFRNATREAEATRRAADWPQLKQSIDDLASSLSGAWPALLQGTAKTRAAFPEFARGLGRARFEFETVPSVQMQQVSHSIGPGESATRGSMEAFRILFATQVSTEERSIAAAETTASNTLELVQLFKVFTKQGGNPAPDKTMELTLQ